ncbi:MAG: hypothetical protein AAF802_04615 [Planctomycetota bacterium]
MLLQSLEQRLLLAADFEDLAFLRSLPSAAEAEFGAVVLNESGKEVCQAFHGRGLTSESDSFTTFSSDSSDGEGEGPESSASVDLTSVIIQQPGPLAPGFAFSSEVTFENVGSETAAGATLAATFDSRLTNVMYERDVIRAQPAVIDVTSLTAGVGTSFQGDATTSSGLAVDGSGDFNNDNIDDFLVGDPFSNQVFVVFGDGSGFPAPIDPSALNGTNGFAISGPTSFGTTVANAGDISGDGIDDIVVGASTATPAVGIEDGGQVFVIFGSGTAFSATLDATSLSSGEGFVIDGIAAGDGLGNSVSGAGDVNGDGTEDLIVGASQVENAPDPDVRRNVSGSAYVIFGSNSFGTSVDLTSLNGTTGFEIKSLIDGDELGTAVASAGDVNNDGVDDVIVSATETGLVGDQGGEVYVVYGQTTAFSAELDVSAIDGTNGSLINASRNGHNLGVTVAGLGDVNGDNIDDIAFSERANGSAAAKTYVVFGNGSGLGASFDLSTLDGSNGFEIDAPAAGHPSEMAVAGAGDVNGDGVQDLIIGMIPDVTFEGGGFVVFGSSAGFGATLGLSALTGANGFQIRGTSTSGLGFSVASAGDVNADGFDDVIVGDPFAFIDAELAGESFVIFGRGTTTTSGTGAIGDVLDLAPGDRVVYRVTATIANDAMTSTTVNASATVASGDTDTNPGNNDAAATTTIIQAPAVESFQVNDGTGSRSQITSVVVTFEELVDHNSLTNAFVVEQIDAGGVQVGTVNVSPVDVAGKTVVTLTFSGAGTVDRLGTGLLGDSLADGNYLLTVLASEVERLGVPMAADATLGGQVFGDPNNDDFFRLYGDNDGDGDVDFDDLNVGFIPAFNAVDGDGNFNPGLDFDGDGDLDFDDLNNGFVPSFNNVRL